MEKYTVERLLLEAMSLMGETEKYKQDYTPFAVDLTNNLIADCFDVNNAMRENLGKAPYVDYPVMTDMESEIPYEYECLKNIMTYGLAFWLLYQDGENDKANLQNVVYETNKQRYARARYEDINAQDVQTSSATVLPGTQQSGFAVAVQPSPMQGDMRKAEYDVDADGCVDEADHALRADYADMAEKAYNAELLAGKDAISYLPISGSNENGTYVKFPDGTMICTKTVPVDVAVSTVSGTLFTSDFIDLGNMAEKFTETPAVSLAFAQSTEWAGFIFTLDQRTGGENVGRAKLGRSVTAANVKGNIYVTATGRWF